VQETEPVPTDKLVIHARPHLREARMVLGMSGWMDGGDVSTGTVQVLTEKLSARPLAEINPEGFYIYNFPGTMEISALFRPFAKIRDGLVLQYHAPTNVFHFDARSNLVIFEGREPNQNWGDYADCIFEVAAQFDVRAMYFLGSVAGVVPHSREPRLHASVSEPSLKEELSHYGARFTTYEGPAAVSTFLVASAASRGIRMVSLVAEVPAYIHGRNPKCIESMVRHVAAILHLHLRMDDLRSAGEAFEDKLHKIIQKRPELVQLIRKLENEYDSEVFDTQMGDLKDLLHKQGIRLD
jgi:proteasome assembly chaperone (PAC2) family protein